MEVTPTKTKFSSALIQPMNDYDLWHLGLNTLMRYITISFFFVASLLALLYLSLFLSVGYFSDSRHPPQGEKEKEVNSFCTYIYIKGGRCFTFMSISSSSRSSTIVYTFMSLMKGPFDETITTWTKTEWHVFLNFLHRPIYCFDSVHRICIYIYIYIVYPYMFETVHSFFFFLIKNKLCFLDIKYYRLKRTSNT